jgi:predicted ATPase
MGDRYVVLSGCSGGEKSTLLAEFRRRDHDVVDEPGRRIVQDELRISGHTLPRIDAAAFARRAVKTALADREAASTKPGWVFFDRGLVDAACALEHCTGEPVLETLGRLHRYHPTVFLAPPWPEIYGSDPERQNGFDAAIAEFERLAQAYPKLGYRTVLLPKVSVPERAALVLERLRFAPLPSSGCACSPPASRV